MATTTTFSFSPNGRHTASIFQPPPSPTSANSSVHDPGHDYFSPRLQKRSRLDLHAPDSPATTPRGSGSLSWTQCATPGDPFWHNSAPVNEQYRLAGGLDTPGLMAVDLESSGTFEQQDCRRRVRDPLRSHKHSTSLPGPLARERNGVPRLPSSPNGSPQTAPGWTRFAFSLVGKVFTFGTSVLSGFYAGGGKGYALKHTRSPTSPIIPPRRHSHDCSTPVPGSWQDDAPVEFAVSTALEQEVLGASPRPQANKRRHTDRETWILVGTPDAESAIPSPKRKPSSTSIARSRPSASRASAARKNLTPLSRRQSSHTHAHQTAQTPQHPPTLDRRASYAPMRSPHSRPGSGGGGSARQSFAPPPASPPKQTQQQQQHLSPEATRFVRRQARADKAADRAMSSMTRRLEDLIRQGQEALGTRVSVEEAMRGCYDDDDDDDDGDDEGFVDEDVMEGW